MLFCLQDLDSEEGSMSFSKNGEDLGKCFDVDKSALGGKALFPHVLTKNTSFEVNFGSKVGCCIHSSCTPILD